MPPRQISGLCDFQLLADGPHGSLFDFAVTRNAGNFPGLRIQPDRVGAAFAVENATVVSKMPFEVGELHALGNFEGFPNGLRGEIFFGELALSVEHELQCLAKIGLGFVQSFTLGNGRGNLFDEGGVAALFGGFEYSSQFHGLRVSQVCRGCRR